MSKEIIESERLLLAEIRNLEKRLARQWRADLREFTKSALEGLCASHYHSGDRPESIAKDAVDIAEAALAELEKRNV